MPNVKEMDAAQYHQVKAEALAQAKRLKQGVKPAPTPNARELSDAEYIKAKQSLGVSLRAAERWHVKR